MLGRESLNQRELFPGPAENEMSQKQMRLEVRQAFLTLEPLASDSNGGSNHSEPRSNIFFQICCSAKKSQLEAAS